MLGKLEHQGLVRFRHAEDAHDYVQGKEARDLCREIAFIAQLHHAIDVFPRKVGYSTFKRFSQCIGFKPVIGNRAVGVMLGSIHMHEGLERAALQQIRLRSRRENRIHRVQEPGRLTLDLDNIGVAGERVKGIEAVYFDPMNRIVAAQPRGDTMPAVEIQISLRIDKSPVGLLEHGAVGVVHRA